MGRNDGGVRGYCFGTVPLLLTAVLVSGCGAPEQAQPAGNTSGTSASANPGPFTPSRSTELWDRAMASLKAARSVGVRGRQTTDGVTAELDGVGAMDHSQFRVDVRKSTGSVFTVVHPNRQQYFVKGNESFLRAFTSVQGSSAEFAKLSAHYLRLHPSLAPEMAPKSPALLLEQIHQRHATMRANLSTATLKAIEYEGKRAWELGAESMPGTVLVLSAEPSADLLRIVDPQLKLDYTFTWNPAIDVPIPPAHQTLDF